MFGVRLSDLVAEVAVDALDCIAGQGAQVGVKRRRWGVTGIADADAVRVIVAQAPTNVRPALPIAAVIEIEEAPIGRRSGMAAGRPLFVNLLVTVAAVLPASRVGARL